MHAYNIYQVVTIHIANLPSKLKAYTESPMLHNVLQCIMCYLQFHVADLQLVN